jgi:predicted lysophospholipase L1 biosynthesis ABC-type transport system permease subunit
VNESFARRFLPGRNAINERFRFGSGDGRPWLTIVGVVGDVRNVGPMQAPRPEIFTPVRQQTAWNQLFVLVRGQGDPVALLPAVREVVRQLDPEQPLYAVRSLEEAMAESSFQQRVAAALLSTFAAIALVLAATGIFGVLAYNVSARTREIGVRLAVGAEPGHVRWLVVRDAASMIAVGLAAGIAGVVVAARAGKGLLFGVEPADPLTIAVVAVVLGTAGIAAAWLPAARASAVDPVTVLRNE